MKGSYNTKVDIQRLAQEFELMKKSIDKLTDQVRMHSSTSLTVSVSEEVHGGH